MDDSTSEPATGDIDAPAWVPPLGVSGFDTVDAHLLQEISYDAQHAGHTGPFVLGRDDRPELAIIPFEEWLRLAKLDPETGSILLRRAEKALNPDPVQRWDGSYEFLDE